MIELIKIIEPYLNSKGNYSTVRKALALLINLRISAFTFENFYGANKWYDINDYKLILDFFIKGNFFVPFVIFIITSSSIILIANLVFYAANHFKTNILIRKIISVEINHQLKAQKYSYVHVFCFTYVLPNQKQKSLSIA